MYVRVTLSFRVRFKFGLGFVSGLDLRIGHGRDELHPCPNI